MSSFKAAYTLMVARCYNPADIQTIQQGVRVPWRWIRRPNFWVLRLSGPKVDKWVGVYVWCIGWDNTSAE